jgi:hypothetical protein
MGGGRRLSSRLEKEFSYCCYEHYLLKNGKFFFVIDGQQPCEIFF